MNVALPLEETFADFARRQGVKPSYITQLKGEGRLVLSDDGRRVRVAESQARIEATRDPSKAGVSARHAAQRGVTDPLVGGSGAVPAESDDSPAEGAAPASSDAQGYTYWRERSERAKALAAERELAVAAGELLEASQVRSTVASAYAVARTSFEALPATLGPQLAAERDEARCIALLAEAVEDLLNELSRSLQRLSGGEA